MIFIDLIRDYHFQWSFVLAVSVFLFSKQYIFPKYGVAPTSLFLFVAMSSLWVWVWRNNRYVTINPYDQMALRYFAADSLLKMTIVLAPILYLAEKPLFMRLSGEVLSLAFVFINSLWVIIALFRGCYGAVNQCGGIVGNPSISVGVMICALPMALICLEKWGTIVLMGLVAIAVYASKSSVAVGLFTVFLSLWVLSYKKVTPKTIALCAIPAIMAMGLSYFLLGRELVNDSDRFMIWKFMMNAWAAPNNLLAGTGLGTYHVFSINLQHYGQLHNYGNLGHEYWWNTLHNEPLQILFECGIIGLILFLCTYFTALLRSIKIDIRLTVSIVLYGLYMTLDPALHNPLPALFGAWLFVYALRKPEPKEIML